VSIAKELLSMGAGELSIGDTIGTATTQKVVDVIEALTSCVDLSKLAMHFHDTHGNALDNILTSYDRGIRIFDSSTAGLGGCPYAKGASGNVATEKVVAMFEQMNVATGIDVDQLVETAHWCRSLFHKPII